MHIVVGGRISDISELIRNIKKKSRDIGAIVIFIGVVRESSRGHKVLRLYYEAQEEIAKEVLRSISTNTKGKYKLIDIAIEHKTGYAKVGEEVLHVVCASRHRSEAIAALEELIDRLKTEVPIWKKEITTAKEYWVKEQQPPKVKVVVNGSEVPLNPFVQKIIGRTILAMISTLKNVDLKGDERVVVKVFSSGESSSGSAGKEG